MRLGSKPRMIASARAEDYRRALPHMERLVRSQRALGFDPFLRVEQLEQAPLVVPVERGPCGASTRCFSCSSSVGMVAPISDPSLHLRRIRSRSR